MTKKKSKKAKIESTYMKVQEVADMFHVSPKTVVRWSEEKRIPHMRTLGGHRRFPRAEMEALRAALEQEVAAG